MLSGRDALPAPIPPGLYSASIPLCLLMNLYLQLISIVDISSKTSAHLIDSHQGEHLSHQRATVHKSLSTAGDRFLKINGRKSLWGSCPLQSTGWPIGEAEGLFLLSSVIGRESASIESFLQARSALRSIVDGRKPTV